MGFATPSKVDLGLGDFIKLLGGRLKMLGDRLMVLRVCIVDMKLAKELLREEDYSSFVMKRSCAQQIHGLKRRNREK